jgi:hypothetical protein
MIYEIKYLETGVKTTIEAETHTSHKNEFVFYKNTTNGLEQIAVIKNPKNILIKLIEK